MATPDPCLPEFDPLKLVREGTEQSGRYPDALDPAYAPINGREPAHSMLFARAYAAYLKYYDLANSEDGDWERFFGSDVSVLLAAAATQDVDRFRTVLQTCYDALSDLNNAANEDVVRYNLSFLFGAVGTLAEQLDRLKESLPSDIPLRSTLSNLIATRLQQPFERLVTYYMGDQASGADRIVIMPLPGPDVDHEVHVLGYSPEAFGFVLSRGLSKDWTSQSDWTDFVSSLTPNDSVFGTGTVFERARNCSTHSLFSGAVSQFLKVYARVVEDAKAALQQTLESYDKHAPHYALFLVFLRLFEYARTEMNGLTGRHLDFYYRDVLRLKERPARPSAGHLLVELAKNVGTHELAKETPFKAGKDGLGNPVTFRSTETLVANKAAVDQVITLHRGTDAIYVDRQAQDEEPWPPFETDAEILRAGFSIGSHYLFLAEGSRTITLSCSISGYTGPADLDITEHLECRLTTEDGWLELVPESATFKSTSGLDIVIAVAGDTPPITAYVADTHESTYDEGLPILEVALRPTAGMSAAFANLESVAVTGINLNVTVAGYRSLAVSNDTGPVDPSQPFPAFGPQPVKDSALVVGCPEAFIKKGAKSCSLGIKWRNRPDDLQFDAESDPSWLTSPSGEAYKAQARLSYLTNGVWEEAESSIDIIVSNTEVLSLHAESSLESIVPSFNPNDSNDLGIGTPFGLDSTTGFVKLGLISSLGHAEYPLELANDVIARVADDSHPLTAPPYTPEIGAITLNYEAEQTIDLTTDSPGFDNRQARLYHVTSLGTAERHAELRAEGTTSVYLFPQLRHTFPADSGAPVTSQTTKGELLIGLAGVVAPQTVSLLFQVEDGTANPLVDRGDEPFLHFSYLSANKWLAFSQDEVDDRTGELLASGIVTIDIPENADTHNTILPAGLTWIRVAVFDLTDAVCRLVGIHAQALTAEFVDDDNDPLFLSEPTPKDTIAKLATPSSAVKSIGQPYETFGGAMAEARPPFYTRVSERLRHKDRAVTLWDIERLVLEAFPSVHRAKCLNHTRYEPVSESETAYHEMAPGHITVICIPDVTESGSSNPLKPYTSLRVLEDIHQFVGERLTCFATLHVRNPQYEEVQVKCDVVLRDGYDESYYKRELKEAVTRFLAPWAYDLERRPTFGGKLYASAVINFIEEQRYVDYLVDFELIHTDFEGVKRNSKVSVEGSRAVSILVSVDAELHAIDIIESRDAVESTEPCGCPE